MKKKVRRIRGFYEFALQFLLSIIRVPGGCGHPPLRAFCSGGFYAAFMARWRKVTTWPRVQVASGEKAVAEVPVVIS